MEIMVSMLGFILLNFISASPLTWLLVLSLAGKTSGGTLGSCFNAANSLTFLAAVVSGVWQVLLPPQPLSGACPTHLLDVSASGTKTSREIAYLLSKVPTEAVWGRWVWPAAVGGSRSQNKFFYRQQWQADWLRSRQPGRGDFWDHHNCLLICIRVSFPQCFLLLA